MAKDARRSKRRARGRARPRAKTSRRKKTRGTRRMHRFASHTSGLSVSDATHIAAVKKMPPRAFDELPKDWVGEIRGRSMLGAEFIIHWDFAGAPEVIFTDIGRATGRVVIVSTGLNQLETFLERLGLDIGDIEGSFGGWVKGILSGGARQLWLFAPSLYDCLKGLKLALPIVVCRGILHGLTPASQFKHLAPPQADNVLAFETPSSAAFYQISPPADHAPFAGPEIPYLHWVDQTSRVGQPSKVELRVMKLLERRGIPYQTQVAFGLYEQGIPTYTADVFLNTHSRLIAIEPHTHLDNEFVRKMVLFKKKCPDVIRVVLTNEDVGKWREDFYEYFARTDDNLLRLEEVLIELGVLIPDPDAL